ncbi:MAG: hypothetical protein AB7D46_05145 [Flavobacteriaceae bacterium]
MKNLKIKLSVLLLMVAIGVYVSSCTADTDEKTIIDNSATHRMKNDRVYYDNGKPDGVEGVDYGCKDTGGTCLDDLIITDDEPIAIISFAYKVTQGNPDEIRAFVDGERDLLLEFFDEALVNEVINGNCNVSGRGDIERTFYFIFKNNVSEEILAVYPISIE